MPERTAIAPIIALALLAGPIVIGQACEFDCSSTKAIKAPKD
ncbi:MAG: hypothetical protein Q8R44_12105 [Novosphingobium sp.]|nr:hypothetical protein [Novosphingobium sp.]